MSFADTYTYTFEAKQFSAASQTKNLGGINWTLTTDAGYFGYATAGQQFGSKNAPAKSLELSTSEIPGNISSIKVKTSGAASIAATLNVKVGETAFGEAYTLTSTSTETEFTGKASGKISLTYTQKTAKAIYIKSITIVTDGKIETTPEEIKAAANIAAFKALASGTTATLTLKNAQVVYKNVYTTKSGATNTEYYVRDASGAIQFFNTDLELNVNQIINGTVEVKYTLYNEMTEATKTANTSAEKLTITDGEAAVPTKVTVADLTTDKYLCDLVTVENANIISETSGTHTNQYLTNGTEKVMIYDKFKTNTSITDGEGLDVTGILVTGNLSGNVVKELAPISAPIPTGINNITTDATLENAPAFNLAGQKVGKAYKGVVIKAGKKFIQK